MEIPEPESPTLIDDPPVQSRQSVFREVPWRWKDVLIGFAPDIWLDCDECADQSAMALGRAEVALGASDAGLHGLDALLPLTDCSSPRPAATSSASAQSVRRGSLRTARHGGDLVVLVVVFSVLVSLFGDRAATTMPYKPIAASSHWYDWVGLLVMVSRLAPVAEEVFFRGMLYNWLRRRLHVVVAAPVQAVIFGLGHHFGPADTAAVMLIGLGLALLYEWRKTLLAPILMHAMVNALAMVVMAQSIAADAAAPRLGVYGETHERGVRLTKVVPDDAADFGRVTGRRRDRQPGWQTGRGYGQSNQGG